MANPSPDPLVGEGAGELVKFGQPVWYRFPFKIPGDWPGDVPAVGRQLCRKF